MRKILASIAGITLGLMSFAGIASAQAYYPGQISWSPAFVYQPQGVPTSQYYNPTYLQPAGIPVTSPSYVPSRPWGTVLPSQSQGVCVTGCGIFGGGFSGFNSGVNIPNGYYPNGFTYQFKDRIVRVVNGNPVIRSRTQTGTFIPF